MSPVAAYFIGVLTIVLIIFIFWLISINNNNFKDLYSNTVCWQICDKDELE